MKISKSDNKIVVNIEVHCDIIKFDREKIIDMVRQIAQRFGINEAKINFAVADDEEITALNSQFLNKNKITDVISFDLSDEDKDEKFFDIAVNAQLAQRQAKLRGHSDRAELALYFLHGLLHNLGFDDILTKDAIKMHKTEDEILEKFGFGTVYNNEKPE
ncbi:MAG: rRNA maturation RNase YbeY [Phycisphaerae bacterium]|nr:rRNA maturation RNase YbeY [Phycisphaerae bacterium]